MYCLTGPMGVGPQWHFFLACVLNVLYSRTAVGTVHQRRPNCPQSKCHCACARKYGTPMAATARERRPSPRRSCSTLHATPPPSSTCPTVSTHHYKLPAVPCHLEASTPVSRIEQERLVLQSASTLHIAIARSRQLFHASASSLRGPCTCSAHMHLLPTLSLTKLVRCCSSNTTTPRTKAHAWFTAIHGETAPLRASSPVGMRRSSIADTLGGGKLSALRPGRHVKRIKLPDQFLLAVGCAMQTGPGSQPVVGLVSDVEAWVRIRQTLVTAFRAYVMVSYKGGSNGVRRKKANTSPVQARSQSVFEPPSPLALLPCPLIPARPSSPLPQHHKNTRRPRNRSGIRPQTSIHHICSWPHCASAAIADFRNGVAKQERERKRASSGALVPLLRRRQPHQGRPRRQERPTQERVGGCMRLATPTRPTPAATVPAAAASDDIKTGRWASEAAAIGAEWRIPHGSVGHSSGHHRGKTAVLRSKRNLTLPSHISQKTSSGTKHCIYLYLRTIKVAFHFTVTTLRAG